MRMPMCRHVRATRCHCTCNWARAPVCVQLRRCACGACAQVVCADRGLRPTAGANQVHPWCMCPGVLALRARRCASAVLCTSAGVHATCARTVVWSCMCGGDVAFAQLRLRTSPVARVCMCNCTGTVWRVRRHVRTCTDKWVGLALQSDQERFPNQQAVLSQHSSPRFVRKRMLFSQCQRVSNHAFGGARLNSNHHRRLFSQSGR